MIKFKERTKYRLILKSSNSTNNITLLLFKINQKFSFNLAYYKTSYSDSSYLTTSKLLFTDTLWGFSSDELYSEENTEYMVVCINKSIVKSTKFELELFSSHRPLIKTNYNLYFQGKIFEIFTKWDYSSFNDLLSSRELRSNFILTMLSSPSYYIEQLQISNISYYLEIITKSDINLSSIVIAIIELRDDNTLGELIFITKAKNLFCYLEFSLSHKKVVLYVVNLKRIVSNLC